MWMHGEFSKNTIRQIGQIGTKHIRINATLIIIWSWFWVSTKCQVSGELWTPEDKRRRLIFMRMELMNAVSPSILFFRHSARPFCLSVAEFSPTSYLPCQTNLSDSGKWNQCTNDRPCMDVFYLVWFYCLKTMLFQTRSVCFSHLC